MSGGCSTEGGANLRKCARISHARQSNDAALAGVIDLTLAVSEDARFQAGAT
jgi:hypothetical protein